MKEDHGTWAAHHVGCGNKTLVGSATFRSCTLSRARFTVTQTLLELQHAPRWVEAGHRRPGRTNKAPEETCGHPASESRWDENTLSVRKSVTAKTGGFFGPKLPAFNLAIKHG